MKSSRPLILQSDLSLLLETNHPDYESCRDFLSRFAELEKSPEHIHTYRLSALSLWNAFSSGLNPEEIIRHLESFSRYEVPEGARHFIRDCNLRYGFLTLHSLDENFHILKFSKGAREIFLEEELVGNAKVAKLLEPPIEDGEYPVSIYHRGKLKSLMVDLGYPIQDEVGFREGAPLKVELATHLLSNQTPFLFRDYQLEAVAIFCGATGGSGVIVLPCGAGKTVVGIGTLTQIKQHTLIVVTGVVAARQWIKEILDKTTLTEEDVVEYSGERKKIAPITVATYQVLTRENKKTEEYPHFKLFTENPWGFIIYDEVHLLPAPIFQITASIQGTRRLGLTATLIREDGKQKDVFSLIGPKKFDIPWKEMEKKKWIAEAICSEVRTRLQPKERLKYARATKKEKFRIASENPRKLEMIQNILLTHKGDRILIIGQYISQLEVVAKQFNFPLVTGAVKNNERQVLFEKFKTGEIPVLVVSKIANFAVDLPEASVAIQISGTFGSRQEEAQRLGRILRPKKKAAHFYTLVSQDTVEQEFALKRQLFLAEQGYAYEIVDHPE